MFSLWPGINPLLDPVCETEMHDIVASFLEQHRV